MVGASMIILWNSSRPLFPLTFEECKQDELGTAWETIRESRSYRAGGGKHEWAVGRGQHSCPAQIARLVSMSAIASKGRADRPWAATEVRTLMAGTT
jgi:hypothetical protein